MSVKTTSVDAKGVVYVNCPFCGDSSRGRAESFPQSNQPTGIGVTCASRGKTYEIQIDFRQCFRKKTLFKGFYSKPVPPGVFEKMTVVDLSLGGCGFISSEQHFLNPGDRIKLVLKLDDAKHAQIERDAAVRVVSRGLVKSAVNLPSQPAAMTLISGSISG